MVKNLNEIFDEYRAAIKENYILLEKCAKSEPPYDGFDNNGKAIGGPNSKAYLQLYSHIIDMEHVLFDLSRSKSDPKPSYKYENVISEERINRCGSCLHYSKLGNEIVCKCPKTKINAVNTILSSNCLCKFDSVLHVFLKTASDRIACRHYKPFINNMDYILNNLEDVR